MNYKNKFLIWVLYAVMLQFPVISQQVTDCGLLSSSSSTTPFKPTKSPIFDQYFRILIVYVTFSDDNYPPLHDNFWQPHSLPISPNGTTGLLVTDEGSPSVPFMNRYPDYTISDWFCEMSLGQLDVIGKEVLVNLQNSSTFYRQQGYSYGSLNRHILETYVDPMPDVDFRDYDKWSFNTSTQEWEFTPDGVVEMIAMVYRYIPDNTNNWLMGGPYSGEASLGGFYPPLVLDGKIINSGFGHTSGSGCTNIGQLLKYSGVTHIIQHEICHSYFVNSLHFGIHGNMGVMVGVNDACYNLSPFERSRSILGWNINPTDVTSAGTWSLGDFVSTGQMLKIQVPGTTNEWFWIANHQKTSLYDGVSRGGKICYNINGGGQNPYCGDGKGIFVYQESPGCANNFGKPIDIEQADGKWNWVKAGEVPYWNPPPYFNVSVFEPKVYPNGSNPNFGYAEYLQVIVADGGTGEQHVTFSPCRFFTEPEFWVTNDRVGDARDAFNIGYDEIFSPYSNPRTNKCSNPIENTGLTLKLLSQDIQGNITVKIYFDDNLALQESPPSKPKNVKVIKHIVEPVSGRFKPKLTWDSNVEPDFTNPLNPGQYKIYRAISYTCDADNEPSYSYYTSVSAATNEFIDDNIYLYPRSGGSGICEYQFRSISYKIEAVDNTALVSLKSDRTIINGFVAPCDPVDSPTTFNTPELPKVFELHQNYPNPFNPSTEIKFSIPQNSFVSLKIYDAVGQLVALLVDNEYRNAGRYSSVFDASHLASGIYFYKIETAGFVDTKKMILIK